MSVLASSAAVLVWFGLYKFIYKQSFSPGLPGEGVFKYVVWRDPASHLARRQNCVRQKQADNKWSSKVRSDIWPECPIVEKDWFLRF